jgi:hypothetical protein
MFRKTKVKIIIAIVLSFFVTVMPAIVYLYPKVIWHFSRLNDLFIIPCVLFLLFPSSNLKIANQKQPNYRYSRWLLRIFIIEISWFLLFVLQSHLFGSELLPYMGLTMKQFGRQMILPILGLNIGFFPWTLLVGGAVYFAYASDRYSDKMPFSAYILNKKQTFAINEVRRILDSFVELSTRLFFVIVLSVLVLQIVKLIYPTIFILTPLNGILVGGILLIFSNGKRFKSLMKTLEEKGFRQGISILVMLVLFFLITFLVIMVYQKTFREGDRLLLQLESPLWLLPRNANFFQLWQIGFWTMATPLFVSMSIISSKGRSIRQFVCHMLILPLLLLGVLVKYPDQVVAVLFSHVFMGFSVIFSSVIAVWLLYRKHLSNWLSLGFVPTESMSKSHYVSNERLLSLFFGIPILILCINITGILALFSIFGLALVIVFFLQHGLLFVRNDQPLFTFPRWRRKKMTRR